MLNLPALRAQELRLHLVSDCYLGLDQEHGLHQPPSADAAEGSSRPAQGAARSRNGQPSATKPATSTSGVGESRKNDSKGAATGWAMAHVDGRGKHEEEDDDAEETFFDASED